MMTVAGALSAQSLTDRFFDEYYFPFNPTTATSAGIHKYDGKLEDYSKAGVAKRVAMLKKFESEFEKLPESPDRDLVLSNIRAGPAGARNRAQLGAESRHLFERHHQQRLRHHEPDVRASGSAPEIAHRPRAPDAQGAGRSAREPEESAADLHRDRDRADARQSSRFFENDVPLAFKP